jgi:hypothetical protein
LQETIDQLAGDVLSIRSLTTIAKHEEFSIGFESSRDHLRGPLDIAGVRVKKASLHFEAVGDDA